MTDHDWKQHFQRAVDLLGSHQALADAITRLNLNGQTITRQGVTRLLTKEGWGTKQIDASLALAVDAVTNGEVAKHDLRPDLWPAKAEVAQ